jgi:hypothetical protein
MSLGGTETYLVKLPLRTEISLDNYRPRLDTSVTVTDVSYDSETGYSKITLPYICPSIDTAVVTSSPHNKRWEYKGLSEVVGSNTELSIEGKLDGSEFVVGTSFKTKVVLSEQFLRDEGNNAVDGVLSLRTLNVRHHASGQYDINISRNNRTPEVYTFGLLFADGLDSEIDFDTIQHDGEFLVRLLGLSNELTISIESQYPEPFNITNLEFRGKFHKIDSIIERR